MLVTENLCHKKERGNDDLFKQLDYEVNTFLIG